MAETLLEENKVSLFASFSPDGSKNTAYWQGRKSGFYGILQLSNLTVLCKMGMGHYYKNCFSPDGRFAVAATSDGLFGEMGYLNRQENFLK